MGGGVGWRRNVWGGQSRDMRKGRRTIIRTTWRHTGRGMHEQRGSTSCGRPLAPLLTLTAEQGCSTSCGRSPACPAYLDGAPRTTCWMSLPACSTCLAAAPSVCVVVGAAGVPFSLGRMALAGGRLWRLASHSNVNQATGGTATMLMCRIEERRIEEQQAPCPTLPANQCTILSRTPARPQPQDAPHSLPAPPTRSSSQPWPHPGLRPPSSGGGPRPIRQSGGQRLQPVGACACACGRVYLCVHASGRACVQCSARQHAVRESSQKSMPAPHTHAAARVQVTARARSGTSPNASHLRAHPHLTPTSFAT